MRVAITGGIAEGKSTVLGYLRESGARTASADDAAREVFADASMQNRIAKLSGLRAPIDRETLRAAIAERPELRRELNLLMHGPILTRLMQSDALFVEIPLLIEACLQARFDRVWVVTCGRQEQLRRLAERLGGEPAALEMLETQLRTESKVPFADRIIRTNQAEPSVKHFVVEALHAENA